MSDSVLNEFREAVIDRFVISVANQQRTFQQYLSLSPTERENDEANAVDDKFTRLTLQWLGYSEGDWSYNLPQSGQKANRPDFLVSGSIGTAFIWEDKNTTLEIEPKHLQQMRRYSIGTAGYAVWCNMRRILAVRFLSTDTLRYETLADVSLEQLYGAQPALDEFQEKQSSQLALFRLLFGKERFTQFEQLVEKIAVDEETFQQRAIDLSSREALKTFTQSSREALDHLRLAALARIREALDQSAQVDTEGKALTQEWKEAAEALMASVGHNQAEVLAAIEAITLGESDLSAIRKVEEALKEAYGVTRLRAAAQTHYETWIERAERINNAVYLQRFQLTSVRRISDAYRVWSNRQSDEEDIQPETFAEQVAYVFFVRLLLVRVLEDKKLLQPRIASDGGFQEWMDYIKRHFSELDGVGILNENFCSLLNRKAGRYYLHFYQQPVFDWFIPDDYLLIETLEFLCRYSFQKVDSDIIGFTFEEYIERVARKRKGHFLTRPGVVEYMLDLLEYKGPRVLSRRILDPACGSGSFLVHAARRYREALVVSVCNTHGLSGPEQIQNDPALRRELAETYLDALRNLFFGMELNPFGCYLAEMNLLIQGIDDLYELQQLGHDYSLDRFHIYNTNSLDLPREVLDDPHVAGEVAGLAIPDRLSDRLSDEAYLLKGRLKEKEEAEAQEKPEDYSGGFFYLVCNPPYVTSKRGSLKIDRIQNTPFFRSALAGDTNLYLLFLKLGTYYLGQFGQMVFIVPLTIFCDASAGAARRLLRTAPYTPAAAVRFYRGDVLFPGVDQAVGIVRVNHSQANTRMLLGGGDNESLAAASQFTANVVDVIDAVPQNEAWKGAWLVYNDPISLGIWNQAKSVSNNLTHRLGALLDTTFGLTEGIRQGDVNATYLNPLRVPRGSYAAGHIAIYKGESIDPFAPLPTVPSDWAGMVPTNSGVLPNTAVSAANTLTALKQLEGTQQGIALREVARLNTRATLIATWFERDRANPLAFSHELWRMILKPNQTRQDGLALLALINSKPIAFLLNLFASNNHVGKDEIARLPIPDPQTLPAARLAALADALLNERANLQTNVLDKYKTKLPTSEQETVYLPPSAVLDKLTLPKLTLGGAVGRGEVRNTGAATGRIASLQRRGAIKSIIPPEEAYAEAFAETLALFLKEPSRQAETWAQAQQWAIPDPVAAASWLQTYTMLQEQAQASWRKFTELQREADAVVADWYGFEEAMREAIAQGLPWARRRGHVQKSEERETSEIGVTMRIAVESSSLAAIGYDAERQILELEFVTGEVFRYQEVPEEIKQALLAAVSKGSYYTANIKGRYQSEKL
jgi:hypothetical protein